MQKKFQNSKTCLKVTRVTPNIPYKSIRRLEKKQDDIHETTSIIFVLKFQILSSITSFKTYINQ